MRGMSQSIAIGLVGLAVGVLVVGASGQQLGGNPDAKKMKNPVAANPESIAAGQKTFDKYCKFCHGADAKGDGPMAPKDTHPSNLIDDKWDRGSSDGEIFMVISEGAGPKFQMKGFKSKLTEQEIWNVVNYVRSLAAKGASR
jgi:mono/diheme cytochrome c family protein